MLQPDGELSQHQVEELEMQDQQLHIVQRGDTDSRPRTTSKPKPLIILDQRLAKAFDFSMDDLLANQQGYITEHQLDVLRAYQQKSLPTLFVVGVFWLVAFGMLSAVLGGTSSFLWGIPAIMLFGVGLFFAKQFDRVWSPISFDINREYISTVRGDVFPLPPQEDYFRHIYIRDHGVLRVPPNAHNKLRYEGYYVIHFAPKSRIVLSVFASVPAGRKGH